MEVWDKEEQEILEKMESENFPESVKTTVIWATRKAKNPATAKAEMLRLLKRQATAKEMVKAAQPMLR